MEAGNKRLFKIILLALVLSFGVPYAMAWTGPTGAPPSANTPAPINTSGTAQTKSGGLTVGSLGMTGTTMTLSGGSETTYGAATVRGSKNGWSGLNFKDAAGTNEGTLMMHPFYSGFFNAADNNWRWYVDDNGNAYQYGLLYDAQNTGYYLDLNGTSRINYVVADNTYTYGNENVNDIYIRAVGKWASQLVPRGTLCGAGGQGWYMDWQSWMDCQGVPVYPWSCPGGYGWVSTGYDQYSGVNRGFGSCAKQ